MPRVPFKKENSGKESAPIEANVQESLNVLGQRTLDQTNDGKLYRKLLGVNYDHLLTNSGIATSTITAEKILTVSGTSLLPATVPVSALGTCNQFSVYRDATAFTMPAGVYSALYANKTLKDVGGGWSAANAWYQLPADGDWWFAWSVFATSANAGKQFLSGIVINSGVLAGDGVYSSAASQTVGGGNSYLYVNGKAGDRIKVQLLNGDSTTVALAVGSGNNYFTGYQVRG